MKKFIFLLCLQFAIAGFAQNSLLFEISGNGLKQNSYLFGTIHVQDEAVFNWNDSVFWAIDQAEIAAFEIDLDAEEIKKDMRPTDQQQKEWKDFFTNDLGPAIQNTIEADTLAHRASSLFAQVLQMELGKKKMSRGSFVDLFLKEYAESRGKKTVGIETVTEQLNVFLNLDKQLIKKSIINFLEEDKWDIDLSALSGGQNDLIEVYSTMKLDNVCKVVDSIYMASENEFVNQFYQKLFVDRNGIMFSRTQEMIKEKSHFIGVGSGHLCSESGLINQYRKAGYTVRPINITSNTTKPIVWEEVKTSDYRVLLPKETSVDPNIEVYSDGELMTSRTIYTTKGKAKFFIKDARDSEVFESFSDEYDYISDDTEYDDGDYDSYEDEDYELAEEMEYAEEAMEAAGEEWEEVEEMDVYDYETEEEYNYETEVEEEINIEVDDDEPFSELPGEETEQEDHSMMSEEIVKSDKDLTQEEYWQKVSRSLTSSALKQSFSMDLLLRQAELLEKTTDTIHVTIMGKAYDLPIENRYNPYVETVVEANNKSYFLQITGDVKFLKSEEAIAFFESFTILE